MSSTASDTIIVTRHAIDALACPGKDKLFDFATACAAGETCGMIRFVAGHDGFIQDGFLADTAVVRA